MQSMLLQHCLLYTSDAADEEDSVDLGGRRIIKKKITRFRQDEIEHKNKAYDEGATKKGPYLLLDKIIKTGSKIAINISEKI